MPSEWITPGFMRLDFEKERELNRLVEWRIANLYSLEQALYANIKIIFNKDRDI